MPRFSAGNVLLSRTRSLSGALSPDVYDFCSKCSSLFEPTYYSEFSAASLDFVAAIDTFALLFLFTLNVSSFISSLQLGKMPKDTKSLENVLERLPLDEATKKWVSEK